MPILLLKNPKSQYSVLSHMEEALYQALERANISCLPFVIDTSQWDALYQEIMDIPISCTLSVNATFEHSLFFESLGVPHIFIAVDAPFWFHDRALGCSYAIDCFPDQDAMAFYEKNYQKKPFWFPHACTLGPSRQYEQSVRDIPFFFPASYLDDEKEYALWERLFGSSLALKMASDVEEFLTRSTESYFQMLERLYQPLHELTSLSKMAFFRSMDTFVRGRDRINLLKKCGGETIHIASTKTDCERYQQRCPKVRFVYEGERAFEELFPLFVRSKCVLNSLPTLRFGLHERVLYALSFGCGVYSTTMHLLPEWIQSAPFVSFYDQGGGVPRPQTKEEHKSIQEWIENEHTYDVRLEKVLKRCFQEAEALSNRRLSDMMSVLKEES